MVFVEGLSLGFANNIFCAATCAPAILPIILADKAKPLYPAARFMLGRFFAYIAFGALSGLAGVYFEGRVNPRIFSVFLILMSLLLIAFSAGLFETKICPAKYLNFSRANLPLAAGFVLGLNICPPFLVGLSRTLELHNVAASVLFFAGFFVGSSAWLAVLMFFGKLPDSKWLGISGRVIALLAGLWYLREGIIMLFF